MQTFGTAFFQALLWATPIYFFLPKAPMPSDQAVWLYGKLVFTFTVSAVLFGLAGPLLGDSRHDWLTSFAAPMVVTWFAGRRIFIRAA